MGSTRILAKVKKNGFNPMFCVSLDGLVTGEILVSVGRVTSDVVRGKRDAKH